MHARDRGSGLKIVTLTADGVSRKRTGIADKQAHRVPRQLSQVGRPLRCRTRTRGWGGSRVTSARERSATRRGFRVRESAQRWQRPCGARCDRCAVPHNAGCRDRHTPGTHRHKPDQVAHPTGGCNSFLLRRRCRATPSQPPAGTTSRRYAGHHWKTKQNRWRRNLRAETNVC
jgi:hypothetical protein